MRSYSRKKSSSWCGDKGKLPHWRWTLELPIIRIRMSDNEHFSPMLDKSDRLISIRTILKVSKVVDLEWFGAGLGFGLTNEWIWTLSTLILFQANGIQVKHWIYILNNGFNNIELNSYDCNGARLSEFGVNFDWGGWVRAGDGCPCKNVDVEILKNYHISSLMYLYNIFHQWGNSRATQVFTDGQMPVSINRHFNRYWEDSSADICFH